MQDIAIPSNDIALTKVLHIVPFGGNDGEVYSSATNEWAIRKFAPSVLPLNAMLTPNTPFSVFSFDLAGNLAFGVSPSWKQNPNSGLFYEGAGPGTCETVLHDGREVNKYSMDVLIGADLHTIAPLEGTFVGGFATIQFAGATCDTAKRRFVSNRHNEKRRGLQVLCRGRWLNPGGPPALGHPDHKVEWFSCVGGRLVTGNAIGRTETPRATASLIAIDSVTLSASGAMRFDMPDGMYFPNLATYSGTPDEGIHTAYYLNWSPTGPAYFTGREMCGMNIEIEN